jgi:hypothetical protein
MYQVTLATSYVTNMNRHLYRLTVIPVELVSDIIEKQQIILVYLVRKLVLQNKKLLQALHGRKVVPSSVILAQDLRADFA